MRIAFCYPPFSKNGRFANLPQNRQFIYTASREVRIFPVVMATAATWMKNLGHEVLWLDGITKRLSASLFDKAIFSFKPEIIILETKAPVMKEIWNYATKLKDKNPKLKAVLVGDHVTYFPEESFKKSKIDYVLTGGDYDFLLKNLMEHIEKGVELEEGIYYRERGRVGNTGKFKLTHYLDEAPIIDRELTCWKEYGEAYLFHPCAYIMTGRGCGISKNNTGACAFCIWQQSLWNFTARLRSPEHVVAEIKYLISLGVKEIFDDNESGPLADYTWLEDFYKLLKKEKLLGKISISSNARGDQLNKKTCKILKKIGYRLVKVGLESGSNNILAKICKKETVEQVAQGVRTAKDEGLRVMLTVMVGYPWEAEDDCLRTYKVTKGIMLYKTRAGDCLQASIITPYPGTTLWRLAVANKWLTIDKNDLEKYDMDGSILKTGVNSEYWCTKIWSIQKDYQFIFKSGITVRNADEILLLLRGAKSLLGHIKDYAKVGK